jgi:hypothetical protein
VTNLHVRNHLCRALLACAARARGARGHTIVTLSLLAKPGEESLAAAASVHCVAPVPVAAASYLSRCGQVSMFIATQTRGIRPPIMAGNGAAGALRTSVAIVIVGRCAVVVVGQGMVGCRCAER